MLIQYKVNEVIEKVDYEKRTREFTDKQFQLLSNEMPEYITKKSGVVQVDEGNGLARLNFRSRVLLVQDGILSEPYGFVNMVDTDEGMMIRFVEEDDIDYFNKDTKIYGTYVNFGVENVYEYHLDNGRFDAISFIFDYGSNKNFLMIASYHVEPFYSNIKQFYDDAKGI